MDLKEMMPWRGRRNLPAEREDEEYENPFYELQRSMNRMFEDFFSRRQPSWFGGLGESLTRFTPRVNVTEDEQAIRVEAELPGMDENDVEVLLTDDALTLKGEKRQEHEEKKDEYYRSERSYGAFRRRIPLTAQVDAENVDAQFKKGVLYVTLPKTAEAQENVRKVDIKSA